MITIFITRIQGYTAFAAVYPNGNNSAILTPDNFTGKTDGEKLQKAIDYALEHNVSSITINRKYDLSGVTVFINKGITHKDGVSSYSRKKLYFRGEGDAMLFKGDSGFMFSADKLSGDISFSNITFSGYAGDDRNLKTISNMNVFDCNNLIRITATNNTFIWCNSVFYEDAEVEKSGKTMQSIVSMCNLYAKNRYVITVRDAYDLRFIGDSFEDCYTIVNPIQLESALRSCKILYCCIEGMTEAPALNFHCVATGLDIVGNYFEANNNHIIVDRFFSGIIIGNQFHGRGSIDKAQQINCISIAPQRGATTISGNSLVVSDENSCLIYIDTNSAYYDNKMTIFGNNTVEGKSKLTNIAEKVKTEQSFSRDVQPKSIELITDIKTKYPSVSSGSVIYTENYGTKIISFNNLKIDTAISYGTLDTCSSILKPASGKEYNAVIVNKSKGNLAYVYVTPTGGLGIRNSTAGIYCGQIVYY